jgi:plasmid stabilization system protein ParE
MVRQIQVTDEANDDLEAMEARYTQTGAGDIARRRALSIVKSIQRLRELPCLHRRGKAPGTREMIVEGHVVIYQVDPRLCWPAGSGPATG